MQSSPDHQLGIEENDLSDNYKVRQEEWGSGEDLGHLHFNPGSYDGDLSNKIQGLLESFREAGYIAGDDKEVEVFESPREHYRMRAKLGVALLPRQDQSAPVKLAFIMWDESKKPVRVDSFPIASCAINRLMPSLLAALESSPFLYSGIRAVAFLSTTTDMLVTLIYKKPLCLSWVREASQRVRDGLGVQVVGRSRGQVYCLDRDYVIEQLSLRDGRVLSYKQVRPELVIYSSGSHGLST